MTFPYAVKRCSRVCFPCHVNLDESAALGTIFKHHHQSALTHMSPLVPTAACSDAKLALTTSSCFKYQANNRKENEEKTTENRISEGEIPQPQGIPSSTLPTSTITTSSLTHLNHHFLNRLQPLAAVFLIPAEQRSAVEPITTHRDSTVDTSSRAPHRHHSLRRCFSGMMQVASLPRPIGALNDVGLEHRTWKCQRATARKLHWEVMSLSGALEIP